MCSGSSTLLPVTPVSKTNKQHWSEFQFGIDCSNTYYNSSTIIIHYLKWFNNQSLTLMQSHQTLYYRKDIWWKSTNGWFKFLNFDYFKNTKLIRNLGKILLTKIEFDRNFIWTLFTDTSKTQLTGTHHYTTHYRRIDSE